MQKYQVFIDEHLISFSEDVKSNQHQDTVFSLVNPDEEDINFIIRWLYKEKEAKIVVRLIQHNLNKLWELFCDQLKSIQAAGGVVINDADEVLFIYRLDKWDLPKGKLEDSETPEIAAVREVEEECGISNLQIKSKLEDTYHIYFHKEHFILKQTFWFLMRYQGNEQLVPQKEESITEAIWKSKSEIPALLDRTYASLKPMINSLI